MGEMRQSHAERAALDAKWQAHPKVVAFKADMTKFIRDCGLDFDVDGMNATSFFAQQWHKEHGPLPDSGILTG